MATEQEVKQAALRVTPKTGKKKLKAEPLSDEDFTKTLLVGNSGSGKTRTIAEILQCTKPDGTAPRVFVASTDIGGNGLRTVRDRLAAVGRPDLSANVTNYDFTEYEEFAGFTSGALDVEVNGKSLWEWQPDLLFWDGYSNFQESQVWRYVLGLEPLAKNPSEVQEAGLYADQQTWGHIRRASMLQIDQFLTMKNPLTGKRPHKIITVLQDDGKEDKFTHENKRGPLVIGAARSYMPAAFDLIVTLQVVTKVGSKVPEYSYLVESTNKATTKQRGGEAAKIPADALGKADFKTLWMFLTATPSPEVAQ